MVATATATMVGFGRLQPQASTRSNNTVPVSAQARARARGERGFFLSACKRSTAGNAALQARAKAKAVRVSGAFPVSSYLTGKRRRKELSVTSGADTFLSNARRRERYVPSEERWTTATTKAQADASDASPSSSSSSSSSSDPSEARGLLHAVWKFTRPHTIRGTILGSVALTSRVLLENVDAIQLSLVPRALAGVVALLCANAFIVGINQIYDVKIDKVNKPYLPIAAGELSTSTAWMLILILGGLGLTIVHLLFGQHIALLYTLSLVIGVVYSVPPLRLKQRPLPAMACIVLCRGFLLNYGVNDATSAALGLPFQWSGPVAFITCFVTCFAVIISVAKDLPDVEGDKENNIKTFATWLGTSKMAMASVGLLLANYVVAMILGITQTNIFRSWVMTGGHFILAILLIVQASKLHYTKYSQDGIKNFYRFIWSLFYTEYLMYPFI